MATTGKSFSPPLPRTEGGSYRTSPRRFEILSSDALLLAHDDEVDAERAIVRELRVREERCPYCGAVVREDDDPVICARCGGAK